MEISELQTITAAMTQELTNAAGGKKNSLPFIRHEYREAKGSLEHNSFQVFVVGGSVYKSALMVYRRGKFKILSHREGAQPVFKTKEDFLSFVASQIDPSVREVGINFAFPMIPFFRDGRLDGKLGYGTKEHAFEGLIGEVVGQSIEEYVKEKKNQTINVGIANDTICLLLSGLTQYHWDEVAAGILGTGMNFALFLDERTPVNLEAANFDKFKQSAAGKVIDGRSHERGKALAEKEVAGAYLYQIFNECIKERGLSYAPLSSTDQLDAIARNGYGEITKVADEVLDRSAALISCEIAGLTNFLKRDTVFVMEGSLFWKGWKMKERAKEYVQQLVPDYDVSYIYIPDAGIMGGAKLVA